MSAPDENSLYEKSRIRLAENGSVEPLVRTQSSGLKVQQTLFHAGGDRLLANHRLGEEVFEPPGIVVRVGSLAEMEQLASAFEGQLTIMLHRDVADSKEARGLLPADSPAGTAEGLSARRRSSVHAKFFCILFVFCN
jgi:hypothetical protein